MLLSPQSRCLAAADRLARTLGIFERPLDAAAHRRVAERRTGLSDFGETFFEEPLEILLRDIDRSANLSLFGRIALRFDIQRFLTNLLLLRERERRDPAILNEVIDRPIFITGMPRSGSTFLHNLIARDPGVQVPRCWQTMHPCPPPRRAAGWPDQQIATVDRQLARFNRLAPELAAIHPIDARTGQECTEILAHTFRSSRFETVYQLEAYPAWLQNAGHLAAYRFHKRFLQHLQHGRRGGRWVLKCPDHLFSLGALRGVYPDASLVFLHRDPLKVLPSVARLTQVLRHPFAREVDNRQIGRQVSESWSRGASVMMSEATRPSGSATPILHLQYRSLIQDPVGAVRALYDRFGLRLGADVLSAMVSYLAGRKDGGYRKGRYDPAAFGLDLRAESRRFAGYIDHFGISREADEAPAAQPFGGAPVPLPAAAS